MKKPLLFCDKLGRGGKRKVGGFVTNLRNPTISRTQLAKALKIGLDTVKEYIRKLKDKRLLKRVGKTRGGYWEVL